MERWFKIKASGSTVNTEIMAGLTTFMAMSYILAVNPAILTSYGRTGMEWYPVFLATALAAGIFTIIMGLFINFPIALAPGMGLNAYFASVIVSTAHCKHPITWQTALTAVFISGIIFLVLTLTRIRQMLLEAIPDALKHAITVGIGLFITFVGMKNSGLLAVAVETVHPIAKGTFTPLLGFETVFGLGRFTNPDVLLTLIGLALTAVLMILHIRGAILFGILGTTLCAMLLGCIDFSLLHQAQWFPDLTQLNFGTFDFARMMETGIISIIFTFTFVELFDTFGTLVGTANRAGFMNHSQAGNKKIEQAMFVDSIAVTGGAILGTSTVSTFVESSAGIVAGGRTGLTSVTTGVCFLGALFLAPAIALIPSSATAAPLIIVGVLMTQVINEINFKDLVLGIPAFMTIIFMPFTYSVANGISFGVLSYVLLAMVANIFGRGEKYNIHWLLSVVCLLIIVRYICMG